VVGGRDLEPPGTHTRTILSLSELRNANVMLCAPAGVMRNSLPGRQIGREGANLARANLCLGDTSFLLKWKARKDSHLCFFIALKKIFEVVIFYLVKAFMVHIYFQKDLFGIFASTNHKLIFINCWLYGI
jgi:hypothetical protein